MEQTILQHLSARELAAVAAIAYFVVLAIKRLDLFRTNGKRNGELGRAEHEELLRELREIRRLGELSARSVELNTKVINTLMEEQRALSNAFVEHNAMFKARAEVGCPIAGKLDAIVDSMRQSKRT